MAAIKLLGVAVIVALAVGLYVRNGINGGRVLGAIGGFAVLGGLVVLLNRHFKDRVVFKRTYRTKN